MVVDPVSLAQELRRRRVGRRDLLSSLDSATGSTWLPSKLRDAPTSLLVLAAMNLTRRGESDALGAPPARRSS